MSRLLVRSFGVSFDGFGAGPAQSTDHPLGVDGQDIMRWFFPTRVFQGMSGNDSGETGIDNGIAETGFANVGACIMGRNMFGPVRGPWPDDSWTGWWGEALFAGLDLRALGYQVAETVNGERATHVFLRRAPEVRA